MLKFGPFWGHFDHLARIWVLARNFGSTGSSANGVFLGSEFQIVLGLIM